MKVKVLGTGCKKCTNLENKIKELISENGIDAEIEKISDINEIMNYGIMMTPGLVIDEEVKSVGIIPKEEQLINWLKGEK